MVAGATILLPVRGFESGKQRLADTLPPDRRRALNAQMFDHVFAVARDAVGASACVVVTPSAKIGALAWQAGARWLRDDGVGLNHALEQARRAALATGSRDLLALSCDLPFLESADLAAVFSSDGDMVVAPDAEGIGTNALLIRNAAQVRYRFGEDSCAMHRAEAAAFGLVSVLVERPGLARDLDRPEHLALLGRELGVDRFATPDRARL